MESDDVFRLFIENRASSKGEELSKEDIEERIDIAKKSPTYQDSVDAMRQNFTTMQKEDEAIRESKAAQARLDKDKVDTAALVNSIAPLVEVSNWKVSDEDKNVIIGKLIEKDDSGKSQFDKLMEDPVNKFKAQWYLENADTKFESMLSYYKEQMKTEFEKGLKEGKEKRKTSPKITATTATPPGKGDPPKPGTVSKKVVMSLVDLYD
jgi:hypothetical protein